MNRITTSRSIFSADSLFSGKRTAAQAMQGKIVVSMIKTPDYEIDMVVYQNNLKINEPTTGVFYEVTTSDDAVYRSVSSELAVKHADAYTCEAKGKVLVNGTADMIDFDEYEIIKDGTSPKVFDFKDQGFKIEAIYNESIAKFIGFVDKKHAKKAHKVKGLFVPSLAK
jgi:hypothetical protein